MLQQLGNLKTNLILHVNIFVLVQVQF